MNILYKQSGDMFNGGLCRFGVNDCYLKSLFIQQDSKRITKKAHHHAGFEMHIITDGCQEYEVDGTIYRLESGSFLLIYPNTPHTVVFQEPCTRKYSVTFSKKTDQSLRCLFGKCDDRIFGNLDFISKEAQQKNEISSTLIENSLLEILVWVFRLSGIKENKNIQPKDGNPVVSLAKQYIEDNIELNITVYDVAKYSYLSTKQLTRIFNGSEDISPGEYIVRRRIARIEELISSSSLSLKQISDKMHFNNEYYFNAFFKKHFGMPPGEYRKMLGQ